MTCANLKGALKLSQNTKLLRMQHGDGVNIIGKAGNLGASPTSVLKEVMASWSWDTMEAANKNESAVPTYQINEVQNLDYQIREEDTVIRERAQTRLQAANNNAGAVSSSDESFHSMTMPPGGGSSSATHQQQQVPNTTTTSSTSKPLGVTKRPTKRRPRASRRVPTTVLEAQSRDFRDLVLKLTGIPPAAAPTGDLGGHILRPQPQRANSAPLSTLDRTGMPPAQSQPSPYMDSHPVHPPNLPTHFPGMSFLQELQRGNSGQLGHGSAFPFLAPKTEGREILDTISTSRPFGVTERSTSTLTHPIVAPTPSLPTSTLDRIIERPRNLTRHTEQVDPEGSRQVASERQSRQASQNEQLSLHQIDWLSYK